MYNYCIINFLIERILKYFSVLIILVTSILIACSIWPRIFDILLSINETHSDFSPLFVTEYFVDHKKYFYLVVFHANAAFLIGITAMIATGTIFVVYLQHACGMFRIAW